MKILLVRNYNPFFESSASGNRFASIIKGLLINNVEVTLLVTEGYCNQKECACKGQIKIYGLKVCYTSTCVHGHYWRDRINKYVLSGFWNIYKTHLIKRYINDVYDYIWLTNNYTILHVFNQYSNTIKSKSIIELNEFNDLYKYDKTITAFQKRKMRQTDIQLQIALKHINCIAVMTNTLMEHYRKLSNPNVDFLYLPMTVDLDRFYNVHHNVAYHKPYIAFTGTYTNAKDGVDILIKAFAKVANKYPTLHLYLAGFWHYDVPMQKELIKQLGIQDRVIYLGSLNKEEIPPFLCEAKLLVLSRPNSHQAQGGFPTKLGEYLATGNPVCVTGVGEIPNYLKDNVSAFLAEPGDVDSFAAAIDRALSNYKRAKEIGANGRKIAEENFSTDIQGKRLYDFLRKDNEC